MEDKVVTIKKKIRSENWIQSDKDLLMQLVRQRYAAIENKNTDHISNYEKKKAWLDLEKHFNNLCEGAQRNIRHLKSQWTAIKVLSKKGEINKRKMSDVSDESRREISEASQDKSEISVEPDALELLKVGINDMTTTSQEIKIERPDDYVEVKVESCNNYEESLHELGEINEQPAKDERFFGPEAFRSIDGLADKNFTMSGTEQAAENSEDTQDSLNESEISLNKLKNKSRKPKADVRQKRKRSDNWLEGDKTLLKELVKTRLNTIENKRTDTLSNHKKKKAWAHVETCFNSLCQGEKRKVHQLKSQWTLLKNIARKVAEEKGVNGISSILFKHQEPSLAEEINKPKLLADIQVQNCMELHAIQMENERKKGRNLDLEYEILLEKKKFFNTKLNDND